MYKRAKGSSCNVHQCKSAVRGKPRENSYVRNVSCEIYVCINIYDNSRLLD